METRLVAVDMGVTAAGAQAQVVLKRQGARLVWLDHMGFVAAMRVQARIFSQVQGRDVPGV